MAPLTDVLLQTVLTNSSQGVLANVEVVSPSSSSSSLNVTSDDSLLSPGACVNVTSSVGSSSNGLEVPVQDIVIVLGMLALWVYSIVLTKKAWSRILKD